VLGDSTVCIGRSCMFGFGVGAMKGHTVVLVVSSTTGRLECHSRLCSMSVGVHGK